MRRTINTNNEFAYDVLNNMIHHSQIVVPKSEVKDSKSIKSIVSRFGDILTLEELQDAYIIKRTRPLDILIRFRKNN